MAKGWFAEYGSAIGEVTRRVKISPGSGVRSGTIGMAIDAELAPAGTVTDAGEGVW